MSKKLADVINNIEKQMESYIQHKADINSFGKVVAIGDGVAQNKVVFFFEKFDLHRPCSF